MPFTELRFRIVPVDGRHVIRLAIVTVQDDPTMLHDPGRDVDIPVSFKTPEQAVGALLDTLTFQPPDMAGIDEAIGKVSGLIDDVRDVGDSMDAVKQRLDDCEDAIKQLAPREEKKRVNPLLAGRMRSDSQDSGTRRPAREEEEPPPSIRGSRKISIGHGTHQGGISGGVMRGAASHTEDE